MVQLRIILFRTICSKEEPDFEKGNEPLMPERDQHLRRTSGQFGVVFIEGDDHGGYGVRRKFNATKVKRLETWEGEGGPAYEDDI